MAVLDPSRASVELSLQEMRDATALVGDGGDRALAALEEAGLARDGAIVPYVARMLTVVGAPSLRIVVERFVAERVIVEQVWAIDALAVWGADGRGGGLELRPLEPSLLAWEIMSAVGLGPRARAPLDSPLRVPAPIFERAIQLLAGGDPAGAEALLADGAALDDAERAATLQLLLDRRSSWRVTSVWTDAAGPRTEWLAVLDGGDSGLWLSAHEGEGDDIVVCLTPAAPSAVWERIVALLPAAWTGPDAQPGPPA